MKKTPIAAVLADLHWTTRTPEYRRETCPFNEVIAKKFGVPVAFARQNQIPLFLAGDMSDRSREFMDLWTLKEFFEQAVFTHDVPAVDVWALRGQHDMVHHDPTDNATTFNFLCSLNGSRLFLLDEKPVGDYGAVMYGASWGDPIPEPRDPSAFNILLWHKTLWHRTPVYPGQVDGNVTVEAIRLNKMGYKMVFSGDNHKAFDVTVSGVEFHNLGAFTRDDVTLRNQRPRFCVLYDDLSVESVYVGELDVFDIERSDSDKGRDDLKDEFSIALAGGFDSTATFKGNLIQVVGTGKCGEAVLSVAQQSLLRDVVNAI